MILYVLKASYVLVIAAAAAVLVPVSIALSPYAPEVGGPRLGVYDNTESRIADARDDAEAIFQQNGTDAIPQVRDYHDILGAKVIKRSDAFFFTIDLAGNPNNNQEYETIYRWHIITTSPVTNREQQYTIMFPHFATGNSTIDGWYFAVYDETVDTFVVRPVKIEDMPENKVEFPVEDLYIGNPSQFSYWVEVLVRIDASFGGPNYLMDYAP